MNTSVKTDQISLEQLRIIIELLDRVTLDINSVEVKLIGQNTGLEYECTKLWGQAYKVKQEFVNLEKRIEIDKISNSHERHIG